jgi:hypothetical protein
VLTTFLVRYPLRAYFLLAYLYTWAIEVPMLIAARSAADMHLHAGLETLAGFGPFAAAVTVLTVSRGRAGVMEPACVGGGCLPAGCCSRSFHLLRCWSWLC